MKACSLVVMVAALAAVGCSTGPTAPSTTPLSVSAGPESIHISVQVVSNPGLARTWQYRATATARFSDGSTEDVTTKAGWTSSNPSVATISIPGEIHVESPGRTDIRAGYRSVTGFVILCIEAGPESGCPDVG
jgi:hypothetical protein